MRILNQLKKPDYIDEVWLSEYEYEEIYDDEGELLGEKKIDIHYHKIA